MRFKVYLWGFPCLDYLSMYQSHESVVWACITSFVHICLIWCFIACRCVPVFMTHFLIYAYLIWIYRYTRVFLCTPLGIILRTRWVDFWQPWTCMSRSRSLNNNGLPSWRPGNKSAQRKCGESASDHSYPFLSEPLLIGSRYSSCCSWATVILFTLVTLL